MAAMNWLFKEEPSNYPFDRLVEDGKTVWSGVRNPVAQKHLHAVKAGDQIFYYHTGDERAIVGSRAPWPMPIRIRTMRAVGSAVVDIAPVRPLPRPVTLAEIKSSGAFGSFPLVRQSRLSVMPVTDDEWARIEQMAGRPTSSP